MTFSTKDTYFDPPRCVCELIIYFEARLFFGLDFSTKDTYFDPPRCVCAINIFLKSRSWLCQQKIYSDPPRLIISLINHITALLRSWLSQQKIQYDPPRCVCYLIIYFEARLFFGLDFLNKRYLFWSAPLRLCFNYIFYIAVLTLSTKDTLRSAPTYDLAI